MPEHFRDPKETQSVSDSFFRRQKMLFSTLKAGGDSKILNLYDSGFMYLIGLPLAFGCAWLGIRDIGLLLLIVQFEQLIRLIFTLKRYNTYVWAKDLTKLVKE